MADLASLRPIMRSFDPTKIGAGGWYDDLTGCAVSRNVLPLVPEGAAERVIGRWDLSQGDKSPVFWLDLPMDEEARGVGSAEHGTLEVRTAIAAEARCLVTDRCLRIACYSGQSVGPGKLGKTAAVMLKVPLSEISNIDPGKSNAFSTGSPMTIVLGDWNAVISVKKAARANDKFSSGIFATAKNKEFAAEVDAARRNHG
jgi:hypothetical protein